MSGSSSWSVLLINPILFLLLVALNIGLYTTGVIMIRVAAANAPALATLGIILLLAAIFLVGVRRSFVSGDTDRQKISFSLGLIIPVIIFGVIASIASTGFLILVADAGIILFIRRLWRRQGPSVIGLPFTPQTQPFEIPPGLPTN